MLMSEEKIRDLLSIAKETVLAAGNFLSNPKQDLTSVDLETKRDIKIRADRESERIILSCLKKKTDFPILSEESGLIKGKNEQFMWIVDPLDGSLNYLRGIPLCCVSIGLYQGNQPILGAVYDFYASQLFTGITGKGAWLNEKKIKVSSIEKKEKAVLCTGFPANTKFSSENLKKFIRIIQKYKKIRLLGSAALSIVYVAAGKADAYLEDGIMVWDIAGGLAILSGAGGRYKVEKGKQVNALCASVSNGLLTL